MRDYIILKIDGTKFHQKLTYLSEGAASQNVKHEVGSLKVFLDHRFLVESLQFFSTIYAI